MNNRVLINLRYLKTAFIYLEILMVLARDSFVDVLIVVIIVMEILHFTHANVAFVVTQMTNIKRINFD